jgi:hypothetical protein
MKQLLNYIFYIAILFVSCKKSDPLSFSAAPAVNFVNQVSVYTFLGNSTGEKIHEIPVKIIGNAAEKDRSFGADIITDQTNAPANLYEILGGEVKAGAFEGVLKVKLKNAPALATSEVKLALRIKGTGELGSGNVESQVHTITWSDKVVIPTWTYYRVFFSSSSSTRVYKLIVEQTGLTTFTAAIYGSLQQSGAEALGVKFGNYVKQWNKDHPNDILVHDNGTAIGQPIVPIYWDKNLYP